MDNVCEIIYKIGAKNKIYGTEKGICRITGKESVGVKFEKWVRDTFTDHAYLQPGTIISNEALFCFDESSELLQMKTNRDKPQRFRTYSHIVKNGEWFCLTKADKKQIFELICDNAGIVSLTDTGQKHLFFKHKIGFWQLDEMFIIPDIEKLEELHSNMMQLLSLGFTQNEIITGIYSSNRIMKAGFENWQNLENIIQKDRKTQFFEFTAWLMYSIKEENENN